jgi:hypothetical protein
MGNVQKVSNCVLIYHRHKLLDLFYKFLSIKAKIMRHLLSHNGETNKDVVDRSSSASQISCISVTLLCKYYNPSASHSISSFKHLNTSIVQVQNIFLHLLTT